MAKKENHEEEKVNQPKDAPIAPSDVRTPVSQETLSHQWQENSPAINTNTASGYAPVNQVAQAEAAEEEAKAEKKEKKAKLSEAEYERRTKLDVSHADYINPSLDHQ